MSSHVKIALNNWFLVIRKSLAWPSNSIHEARHELHFLGCFRTFSTDSQVNLTYSTRFMGAFLSLMGMEIDMILLIEHLEASCYRVM